MGGCGAQTRGELLNHCHPLHYINQSTYPVLPHLQSSSMRKLVDDHYLHNVLGMGYPRTQAVQEEEEKGPGTHCMRMRQGTPESVG